MADEPDEPDLRPALLDRRSLHLAGILLTLVLIGAVALSIKLERNLSHLEVAVFSGSPAGNYHALVEDLRVRAARLRGRVANVPTEGSIDNLERLGADADCRTPFALVQQGLDWDDHAGVRLLARLPIAETVFFLGPGADDYDALAELDGTRIGIGPEGSGTAAVARALFAAPGVRELAVELEHGSVTGQLAELAGGSLDLAMFVMATDAELIRRAVLEQEMQIAGFATAGVLAHHLEALRAGRLAAGHYDPVAMIPPVDKPVLQADTLVVAGACAARSDIVGMLMLLQEQHPEVMALNRAAPAPAGLAYHDDARGYFEHGGPELLDRYLPWVADLLPLASLVQVVMVVSILFNFMGLGHRFRLWRVDAARVNLEQVLPEIFGPEMVIQEIAGMEPADEHRTEEKIRRLERLIRELEVLKNKVRRYSLSILVPMGQEMAYRYQESLVTERIAALRTFRAKLD